MEIMQVRMDAEARSAGDPARADAIQRESAEGRQRILDKLQTACQQACPTQAIVFGNINSVMDPIHAYSPKHRSDVARLKGQPLNYSLLAELTTQPRTTYLARVINDNPALAKEETAG
jgi:molybdopterin-containing oxidoreductase family iron-sulfur binding subunit